MESILMQMVKYSQELVEQVENNLFKDQNGHMLEINQSWYDFVATLTVAEAYFGSQTKKELGTMKFVKVELEENVAIPSRATENSAGYDFSANETVIIQTGETKLISTGISFIDIPSDVVGVLSLRSSIALKRGLILANGVGIIDSDYRDEIKVMVHSVSKAQQIIKKGERIAQLTFLNYLTTEDDDQQEKSQRTGGFGSTNK